MKKSTEPQRLPDPPERTAFRTGKDGKYHHTMTRADLHLDGVNVTGATTGRFSAEKPNFSNKPGNKPENTG